MKSLLVFLVLLALVFCQPNEFSSEARRQRRQRFQKEMADCIVNTEGVSAELKKQVEDNKDDDLRKVLHLYITKLGTHDHEIIRKCRRELFGKMREMHKGLFQHRFNRTFPFLHHRGNLQ